MKHKIIKRTSMNNMTTLADIRNLMLSNLDLVKPVKIHEDEYYYDEDGHCGYGLYQEIKSFWERFESNKDFEYLVSGKWYSDDLDLSGRRSNLLSGKLVDLCFDYMVNVLEWSEMYYEGKIFDSSSFTDDIFDKYRGIQGDSEVTADSSEKQEVRNSDDYIIMKYPNHMKSKLDKLDLL